MDVYTANLTGLLGLCAALFFLQRKPAGSKLDAKDEKKRAGKKAADGSSASQWPFLVVFALVMGSDWLQGPFLYSLYRVEHGVSASLMSTFFMTGFLSGAVSGYFVGSLADRHGRKAACLVFCAASALSCMLTTIPSVPLLFAGRVLGGVGTSLLFSVFESWMVADFHGRRLQEKGGDLSRTFGLMSTLNSLVAIASGVFSEWIVGVAGTRKAPFAASAALLGVAAWLISTRWTENYGEAADNKKDKGGAGNNPPATTQKLRDVLTDPQVLALGLASTMFEGSMYLFVFYWTPALQAVARQGRGSGEGGGELPYGIIFAAFMASTLAASLAFNAAVSQRRLVGHTALLAGLLAASELALFVLAGPPTSEQATFWLFCVFEACVGLYWPCMGYLKGRLVDDGVRARVYGLLRVPLNLFVVAALLLAGDADASFPTVFATCSKLLLGAVGAVLAVMLNQEQLP